MAAGCCGAAGVDGGGPLAASRRCHAVVRARAGGLPRSLALVSPGAGAFGVGLLLSLVDADGFALQLYPFRLADTLLPLTLVLLGARALQALVVERGRLSRSLQPIGAVAVAALLLLAAVLTSRGAVFRPGQAFAPPPEKAMLYPSLMASTPHGARVLTPPGGSRIWPCVPAGLRWCSSARCRGRWDCWGNGPGGWPSWPEGRTSCARAWRRCG